MAQTITYTAPYHFDYKAITLGAAGGFPNHVADKVNGDLIMNIFTLAAPGNAMQTTYTTALSAVGITIIPPLGDFLEIEVNLWIRTIETLSIAVNGSSTKAQAYAGIILIETDGNLVLSAVPIFRQNLLINTDTAFGRNTSSLTNFSEIFRLSTNLKPKHSYTVWTWTGTNVSVIKNLPVIDQNSSSAIKFDSNLFNIVATIT